MISTASLLLATAPLLGLEHANSFSRSEIAVREGTVRVELRVQVLSVGEVVDGFDPELDGHAEDGELALHQDEILGYIQDHYRLYAGPGLDEAGVVDASALSEAERLPVTLARAFEGPLALDPMNEVSEWIDVVMEFKAPEPGFRRLGVVLDLFALTSPGHSDSAVVTWNGLEIGPWMFNASAYGHVFEATDEMLARNASPFRRFARASLDGAPGLWRLGWIALILVLGAAPRFTSPVFCTALFGVSVAAGIGFAHEIPKRFDFAGFAALTVHLGLAYLALDEIVHRQGRTRVLEPLVFGAVAGVGIGLGLGPSVATEADPAGARLGAAVVTGGMLVIAGVLGSMLLPSPGRLPDRDSYSPRLLRILVAVPALGLGALEFIQVL